MQINPLQRVLSCAESAREALGRVFASVGLAQPRMSDLRERLGLDKSIASRVARAVRMSDAGAALRELPAAEALGQIVGKCEALGAGKRLVAQCRKAIKELDAAIGDFPGDRTALITAISATESSRLVTAGRVAVPKVSEAKLRAARRGAYNAALFAQGICCETQALVNILLPSEGGRKARQAQVLSTTGLRRLRPGYPQAILSLLGRDEGSPAFDRVTLTGEPIRNDPGVALIPEFCTDVASQLRLERVGRVHSLVLEPHSPPLDEPMDFAYGYVNLDFTPPRATETTKWTATSFAVSRATRILLREVLVHRESFGEVSPLSIFTIDSTPMVDPEMNGPDPTGRGRVDQGDDLVPMGKGYRQCGRTGEDFAVPLALRALEMLGRDPDEFDRYRLVVEYPLPLVRNEVWIRLRD
ncbi:MAG: hypothetical protein GC172_03455 [Phycisphaera sp.]|nr:hypothetical protein [Phycisphaera sp.]